jgi:preprotein translocase subunit SecB
MLSPLQLKGHRFSALEVKALPHGLTDGRVQVSTRVGWSPHAGHPGEWQLTLHVTFGPADPKSPAPYQGSAEIAGLFSVDPAWPADHAETLVQVNGASILYGATREMILAITARSTHGEFLLPTVSFVEAESSTKRPTKGSKRTRARTDR